MNKDELYLLIELLFKKLISGQASRKDMLQLLEFLEAHPELAAEFKMHLFQYFEGQQQHATATEKNTGTELDINTLHDPALQQKLENSLEEIGRRTGLLAENNKYRATDENLQKAKLAYSITEDTTEAPLSFQPSGKPRNLRILRAVRWQWAAAAIALLIGLGAGFYYIQSNLNTRPQITVKNTPSQILPGIQAATLTLSDGNTIQLDSTAEQQVRFDEQVLARNKNGQLRYEQQSGTASTEAVIYNTLTTHKGNQYKLILPDGTKVWLNAESSIRFPTSFDNAPRLVSITGEVYFEVEHNPRNTFKVRVKGQTIEDFGTIFNVNAYDNEPGIKTTLIEGSIAVNNTKLHPGEQALVATDGSLTLRKGVDLDEIIAWKNNMFLFHQMDMKTILRQVARWYNVSIDYQGKFDETFTGGISRQTNLSEILKILSYSDKIKFTVHDRTITIQQK
ncbi:MAG TPA: FecR family protein [Arachidicoccus sp.]|nr:FecR family protein [Arachidicoccus sp.]